MREDGRVRSGGKGGEGVKGKGTGFSFLIRQCGVGCTVQCTVSCCESE